jgi:uncharacterized tellurite resistance protein B-like protein
MAHEKLIKALAKVIIAAAWADGEITLEEVNSLKDLLFHMPGMTASDWHELQIYLSTPIDEAERQRLVEDLQTQIRTRSQKQLALDTLEKMILADGVITDAEHAVAAQIREAIEETSTGVVGVLGSLVKRNSQAGPNREHHLEDFVRNRVYYGVRRKMGLGEADFNMPDDQLRRLSLAGGMMAQIVHTDDEVNEDEYEAMVNALMDGWHIGEMEARVVVDVAISELGKDLDTYRIAREFFEVCDRADLIDFVRTLFHVAAADGYATADEIREIRVLSQNLLLTHQEFIDAKLSLPREMRAE